MTVSVLLFARYRDDDAGLADIEEADPVENGDVRRAEARLRFAADFAHHRLGHFGIRVILERAHPPALVMVARGADEGRDGAPVGPRHRPDRLLQVDRSLDDPVKPGHGVPPAYPPLTGGKTAISSRPVSARSARA